MLLLMNAALVAALTRLSVWAGIFSVVPLFTAFVYFNIRPSTGSGKPKQTLADGCELMLLAAVSFALEIVIYAVLIILPVPEISRVIWVVNTLACVLGLLVLLINGIAHIFIGSGQLGLMPRILLLFCWWVPVLNIILLRTFFRAARMEYNFTANRVRLNAQRAKESVCGTKYPVLMVHGIFFRDWKQFNYWGRIPDELIKNGARIYYGDQQSSAPVEQSAEELKQTILRIIEETGCEKVNIIAHSKGGLDARYAISKLGMAPYVASLTTINTPHRGCNYVGRLLELIPQKTVKGIGAKYDTLFTVLGDDAPDFFSGLLGLTDEACAVLNEQMPDMDGVLYQSIASKMKSASSAVFPLSLGYRIAKRYEGDNDGLVSVKSMEWGHFLGVLSPAGKKGISHGDMIDLTRKNIPGFDVCECYIDLVYNLKEKGL